LTNKTPTFKPMLILNKKLFRLVTEIKSIWLVISKSYLERFNVFYLQLISIKWFWLKSLVVLVFLFSSVILLVNSRCSSLMFNHLLINSLIIPLTLTLLQCYFNTIQRGTKCYLSRVDLTLWILLCRRTIVQF